MIKPAVVANWKMNKTPSETEALLSELLPAFGDLAKGEAGALDVILAPSFVSLPIAAKMMAGSGITLAAQDCHWSEEGPCTGEVSAKMLAEVGCRAVILGHSERREFFGETNRRVNMKAKMALFWGLTPILCVGEKADDRASGHTAMVVEKQLKRCLEDVKLDPGQRLMIAYEPVWSIGTGKTPSPSEVADVHHLIGAELVATYGEKTAATLPILYGGSVSPALAATMMSVDSVNGVLVGAASLEAATFLEVAEVVRGRAAHSE